AFTLVLGPAHLTWADAMGVVVAEGIIITLLVLTGFREAVLNAIPMDLKRAIGIGIGLLIAFIGLVNAGVVVKGTPVVTIASDFFDTMGTVIGIAGEAGLLDRNGRLPGMQKVLIVDSLAAAAGGAASASSNTTFIESAAGVSEGGRTGLTSVVVGVLFLACLFISPIAGVIPPEATAPVLIIVGYFMMTIVKDINWQDPGIGIPALLTMVVMPF